MNKAVPQTACVRIPDGATFLVVDRNPFFRRALRRTLELEGISVVEAGDGEQALRVIEADAAQLLDVVLTSLLLPVVSAPELIAVLLECRPELPVVAMSAFGDLPADLPPVPLLRKPFDHEELVRTVAPLALSSQAMRRQARQARADAAELRSFAERQRAIARDQVAKSGDLMIALMRLRRRLSLQLPPGSLPLCHELSRVSQN
jgi:DNA-binding NtrC family response regulator